MPRPLLIAFLFLTAALLPGCNIAASFVASAIPQTRQLHGDNGPGNEPWLAPSKRSIGTESGKGDLVTGRWMSTGEPRWPVSSSKIREEDEIRYDAWNCAQNSGLMSHYDRHDTITIVCMNPLVVIASESNQPRLAGYDGVPETRISSLTPFDPNPRACIRDEQGDHLIDIQTDTEGSRFIPVSWGRLTLTHEGNWWRVNAEGPQALTRATN